MPSLDLLVQAGAVGVLTGGVYALLASGLTLIFGVMKIVHISHAAFIILAAYLTYFISNNLGIDPLLTVAITAPLFFVLGVLVQHLLLSRLKENKTMMSVLLTFAIAIVIEGGIGLLWTSSHRSINVAYGQEAINFGVVRLPIDRTLGFLLAATTLALLFAMLRYSRYGQALRATIQHPAAARLVGVNEQNVSAIGFGLGLATAAIGGAILAILVPFFPASHYAWIGRLMAIIVLGGLGSVGGAAIAAVAMGVVESLVLVSMDATWASMIFFIVLFMTLALRPHGLFGGHLAERF
ncbi:MAG: branched-chain amino acid ABC transporter permease [Actinomycetota bacterium]